MYNLRLAIWLEVKYQESLIRFKGAGWSRSVWFSIYGHA